jgi:adenylate cyclase, class 2
LPNSSFFALRACSLVKDAWYFFWETQEVSEATQMTSAARVCLFIRQFSTEPQKIMPLVGYLHQKSMHINYEFKSNCDDIEALESKLKQCNPRFVGTDHQVDTYFNVPHGRMKLREGTIENSLIYYDRINTADAKQSNVSLYHPSDKSLKQVLEKALGIKIVVDKKRKIYFVDNVKFHFDEVKELGSFVEVEAIDKDGSIGLEKLKEQCSFYVQLFDIRKEQFIAESYSDLLAKKSSTA